MDFGVKALLCMVHGVVRGFPMGLSSILAGEGLGPDAVLPNSYVSEPTRLARYGISELLNAAVAG